MNHKYPWSLHDSVKAPSFWLLVFTWKKRLSIKQLLQPTSFFSLPNINKLAKMGRTQCITPEKQLSFPLAVDWGHSFFLQKRYELWLGCAAEQHGWLMGTDCRLTCSISYIRNYRMGQLWFSTSIHACSRVTTPLGSWHWGESMNPCPNHSSLGLKQSILCIQVSAQDCSLLHLVGSS